MNHDRDPSAKAFFNNLLVIFTNYSEQKAIARRTIQVPPGTGNEVQYNLRHLFITEEVPGGYCGTEFNDAFGVEARIVLPNGQSLEPKRRVRSMNQLGCSAFTADGRTGWMDFTISAPRGAKLEVEAFVQNVGDAQLQSYLVIDGLDDPTLLIADLVLKDLLNYKLEYISIANSLPQGVNQLAVRGRLKIRRGVPDTTARASRIVLRLRQGQRMVEAPLSAAAANVLLNKPVPASGALEWNSLTDPLFVIPHSSLAGWDTGPQATVSLEAELTPTQGKTTSKENNPKSLKIVTRSPSLPVGRYGGRDAHVGGDDWGRKSTIDFLGSLTGFTTMTLNDGAKAHAGVFPPHSAGGNHTKGTAVDMKFQGFPSQGNASSKTGTHAARIIELLTAHGNRIERIGTTFPTTNGTNKCRNNAGQLVVDTTSAFYTRLANAGLANSQNTGKVRCYSDHGHLHIDIKAPAATTAALQEQLVAARKRGFVTVSNR